MTFQPVCDYSFARPNLATLKQAGYQGVMRYLAPLPNQKVVTVGEANAIRSAGLGLGLVWESVNGRALSGATGGLSDGTEALRQAAALGFPADRPIYFVAEDPARVALGAWPTIEAYFLGLMQGGVPLSRIGAYGSQLLVEHLVTIHLASWGWQVEGWSSGISGACQLYQRLKPTLVGGAVGLELDEDAVLSSDWGGWMPDAQPALSVSETPIQIGDNMQKTNTTVLIRGGQGWCDCPVPAASVVSVLVMDQAPGVIGGYPDIPAFAGLATDQAPNGVLVFRGGADGTYGVTVVYV